MPTSAQLNTFKRNLINLTKNTSNDIYLELLGGYLHDEKPSEESAFLLKSLYFFKEEIGALKEEDIQNIELIKEFFEVCKSNPKKLNAFIDFYEHLSQKSREILPEISKNYETKSGQRLIEGAEEVFNSLRKGSCNFIEYVRNNSKNEIIKNRAHASSSILLESLKFDKKNTFLAKHKDFWEKIAKIFGIDTSSQKKFRDTLANIRGAESDLENTPITPHKR